MITTPAGTTASMLRRWWPALLVASVAVGVFSNSFSNEFIYDDWTAIVENPTIRSWSNIWELINPTSTFNRTFRLTSYRPLQNFSYLISYMLFGLNAGGHHIFNVALHSLNTALVFVVLRRLTSDKAVSIVGAVAFAVHPIHMEAVQVSGLRADLLSTLFFLISLLCHSRLRDRPQDAPRVWAGLSAVSYFLSCAGKEIGVTVPLMALFLDARSGRLKMLLRRDGIRPYFGYGVAAALYAWLHFGLFSNVHQGDAYLGGSPLAAMLTTGRIFVSYLGRLLLPINIRPDYLITPSTGLDVASAGAWAFLGALAVIAWLARRRWPIFTLGLVWLGVTLLPVANLVPIRNPIADRYLYLPSIGFCAIFGWAAVAGGRAAKERWGTPGGGAVAILGASVLIAWGAITWKQNTVWGDNIALWSHTVRLEPASSFAHYNLGFFYEHQGQTEQAKAAYSEAIRLDPNYAEAHNNLGIILLKEDNNAEAEAAFRRAVAADRAYASAYNNLGFTYQRQGLTEQAKAAYSEAIRLNPNYAKVHNNLGTLLESEGNYVEAEASYRRAMEAEPSFAQAHLNLAKLYINVLGAPEKGLPHLEAVIRLAPDHPLVERYRYIVRQIRQGS
ncbi:MAG: tetratricopeptide repeat protein [bacterium]